MVPACNNQFAIGADHIVRIVAHQLGQRIIEANMVIPAILFGAGDFIIDDQASIASFVCAKQRGA